MANYSTLPTLARKSIHCKSIVSMFHSPKKSSKQAAPFIFLGRPLLERNFKEKKEMETELLGTILKPDIISTRQRTVLAWIPAAAILIFGFFELSGNRNSGNNKIPLNVFNLTKIGATLGRITDTKCRMEGGF